MRAPCEKWLEALLAVEPPFTNPEIMDTAIHRRFVAPQEIYLALLRKRLGLTKPIPFDPESFLGIRWLKSQQLVDWFRRPRELEKALQLLGIPDARLKVETLILGGLSALDISAVLSSTCGYSFEEDAILYYRYYFWNPEVMAHRDWVEFFKSYPNGELLQSVYDAKDRNAALARAGVAFNIDVSDLLNMLAADAYARYKALGCSATDKDTRLAAETWSNILLRAMELKIKRGDVSTKFLEILDRLFLDSGPAAVATVHSLRERGDKLISSAGFIDAGD